MPLQKNLSASPQPHECSDLHHAHKHAHTLWLSLGNIMRAALHKEVWNGARQERRGPTSGRGGMSSRVTDQSFFSPISTKPRTENLVTKRPSWSVYPSVCWPRAACLSSSFPFIDTHTYSSGFMGCNGQASYTQTHSSVPRGSTYTHSLPHKQIIKQDTEYIYLTQAFKRSISPKIRQPSEILYIYWGSFPFTSPL